MEWTFIVWARLEAVAPRARLDARGRVTRGNPGPPRSR